MTKRINDISVLRHVLVWAVLTTYLCILDPVRGPLMAQIVVTFFIMFNYMVVFYSMALYILPKYWEKHKFKAILATVIIFFISVGMNYINFSFLSPFLGSEDHNSHFNAIGYLSNRLYIFSFVAAPAIVYYWNNVNVQQLYENNEREKLLMVRELNFLKSEFNSHITFNFLNYCYSKIHKTSEEMAKAIDLFSDMLRYSLTTKTDQEVLISNEIDYIQNYIDLQCLLTANIYVDFTYDSEVIPMRILPRILLTFIENAFKHGNYSDKSNPIKISLTKENRSSIKLSVSNLKRHNGNVAVNSGIGLTNVRQLLQLYYPDRHHIDIVDGDVCYKSKLIVNLSA